jgi:hypothetical protein
MEVKFVDTNFMQVSEVGQEVKQLEELQFCEAAF